MRQVCPHCDGDGFVYVAGPPSAACCGNLTPAGSCRDHCIVPVEGEPVADPCGTCNGVGHLLVDTSGAASL